LKEKQKHSSFEKHYKQIIWSTTLPNVYNKLIHFKVILPENGSWKKTNGVSDGE
jgi:hypothetical protein